MQSDLFAFPENNYRTLAEWQAATKQLLEKGQSFYAYHTAKSGILYFPDNNGLKQMAATALIRTGALERAKAILEPLCADCDTDDLTLNRILSFFRKIKPFLAEEQCDDRIKKEAFGILAHLIREFKVFEKHLSISASNDETWGLLARVYKDLWKQNGQPEIARQSRDVYLKGFYTNGGYYTGINAAAMSAILGEYVLSEELAQQVLNICQSRLDSVVDGEEKYWLLATIGEANLLLQNPDASVEAYKDATRFAENKYSLIVSSVQQLKMLLKNGFDVPEVLFEILSLPAIVTFTGHMIDRSDRPEPRFPAQIEEMVSAQIEKHLDELDARIGYTSAACGSDILFIENMLNRGAEVNIILPFSMDDFIHTSVDYAGSRWVERFHRVLKLANSVSYVTEEKFLGDDILFGFGGKIFYGFAWIRSYIMEIKPYLLTVSDGKSELLTGGTSEMIKNWPDKKTIRTVNVSEILKSCNVNSKMRATPNSEEMVTFKKSPYNRVIKTILFADVVGYSKVEEEHVPFFMFEFLKQIASDLKQSSENVEFVNTWGDAIFVVMNKAEHLLKYAFDLHKTVSDFNSGDQGLPDNLDIRIALHAGPVYEGTDPITDKKNFYGSHITRAARIEPVTAPGCIYATEQFIAMLTMEHVTTHGEDLSKSDFVCEYLGKLSLYKNFGSQAVYHVRKKSLISNERMP